MEIEKNVRNLPICIYNICVHVVYILKFYEQYYLFWARVTLTAVDVETISAAQIDLFKIFNLKLCVNICAKFILVNNTIVHIVFPGVI